MDDDLGALFVAEPAPRVVPAVHGAYHAMMRRLEQSSRVHGLEGGEALVLTMLLRDDGCPPWELRRRTGLRPSTMASLLDRIERDRLILRSKASLDGRRFEVRLSRAGRVSARFAEQALAEIEAEIAGYTSLADRRAAVEVYGALVAINRPDRSSVGWS